MTSQPVIEVQIDRKNTSPELCYLHLLKSPTSNKDCVSPICTRDMTNYVHFINSCTKQKQQQQQLDSTTDIKDKKINDSNINSNIQIQPKISLIHLHEDVWHSKTDIVQSRLRNRFGKIIGSNTSSSRIYARKTIVRRIDAGTAIPFLHEYHLWSATKARYYYGLFLPQKEREEKGDDVLVAVATFSTKRRILHGTTKQTSRSFELIRFCTRANTTVIGGITKLIRAFIKDQKQPVDEIVTVVDRDWGPGDGWHSIGFETMHVMAPVVMVVKDGVRRYLVGAGIENEKNKNDIQQQKKTGAAAGIKKKDTGRPGIDKHVWDELIQLDSCDEAMQCLQTHDYYPVYDAGVERLIMVVPGSQDNEGEVSGSSSSAFPLASTVPSYAASYTNSPIQAILSNAVALTASSTYGRALSDTTTITSIKGEGGKVNDSIEAQQDTSAWRSTGKFARNATLLYTAPSSMDPEATVELRERPGGWCTFGIVGGRTKSIWHGNFKFLGDSKSGLRPICSNVLVSEYLRSMAAMAMAGLEFRNTHPDGNSEENTTTKSFLYLGYGAGSLSRFMASAVPGSQHVAIELDDGVVSAAHNCNLLQNSLSPSDTSKIELHLDDALAYNSTNNGPFDVVFVDIFDEDNALPPDFYSKEYLERLCHHHLGSNGIVVHNFHTGGRKRSSTLHDAIKAYRSVFATTLVVESLESRSTGGNAILLATNKRRLDATSETLSWNIASRKAQQRWGVNFDVIARTTNKLWFS